MQNYEELIWDKLPGNTPKDRYDYLVAMEQDLIKYRAATNIALTHFKGFKETPDTATVENLRSIIEVGYAYFVKVVNPSF